MLDGLLSIEKLLVKADAGLYHFINQGCLTVETINDPDEYDLVDVRSIDLFSNTPIIQ